jgi:hypothetical protein
MQMKYSSRISLHVKHPTRDLSSVCDTLELHPLRLWKVGDERRTPKGRKIGGLRKESAFSAALGSPNRSPLSKQIETALMKLKPHRRMLRRLSSTGGQISFFVGWFLDAHAGESFSDQILKEMADLRIALDLNIYVRD